MARGLESVILCRKSIREGPRNVRPLESIIFNTKVPLMEWPFKNYRPGANRIAYTHANIYCFDK